MMYLKILSNRSEYLSHGSSVDIVKWDRIKLAYITVPKTANTSIKTTLSHATGILSENDQTSIAENSQRIHGILRTKDGVRISRQELLALSGYTIFATVRHPRTRFLSFYKDKIQSHGWPPQAEEKFFDLWNFSAKKSAYDTLKNIRRIPDQYSEMHFRSQAAILGFPNPPSGLLVYKFEELDKLWNWLHVHCAKYGVELPVKAPRINATAKKELPEAPRMDFILRKRYAADYDQFGYV